MSQTIPPAEQEVLERIREELDRRSRCRTPSPRDEGQTWGDLDVDSLDLVELVKALEDEYGIQIADEELEACD